MLDTHTQHEHVHNYVHHVHKDTHTHVYTYTPITHKQVIFEWITIISAWFAVPCFSSSK